MFLWKQGFHKLLWEQVLLTKRVRGRQLKVPATSDLLQLPGFSSCLALLALPSLPPSVTQAVHTKKPSAWAHQPSWTQGAPQQVSVFKTAFPSNHPRFTQDRNRIWTSTPGNMSQSNLDCTGIICNRENWCLAESSEAEWRKHRSFTDPSSRTTRRPR